MRALALILLITLAACGGAAPAATGERLAGTWANELVSYTFDPAAGTMTRTALGTTEEKPLTIVSEDERSVTFRTDGDPLTATFEADGTILLAQSGRAPVVLTREP